jgi:cytoskeletal protein RodZ
MPDMNDPLLHSRETRHELKNYIMITDYKLDGLAERHDQLSNKIDNKNEELAVKVEEKHKAVLDVIGELKSILKWAGGLVVMLFISTLTWSLAQQYSANEAQKKDMQQQLDILREQERARNANRAEILSRLPAPSTPEAASSPVSVTKN